MSLPTFPSSLLFFAQSFKSKQVLLPVEDCCALAALTLARLLFCSSVYASEDVFVCARLLRLRWPCFLSIGAFTLQELSPCKTGVCAGTSLCLSFLCRRLFSFICSLPFSAAATAAAWVLPAVDTERKLRYMRTLRNDTGPRLTHNTQATSAHLLKCLQSLFIASELSLLLFTRGTFMLSYVSTKLFFWGMIHSSDP